MPEDRLTTGLVTNLPLADSMVLPRIGDPGLQPQRPARAAARSRAFAEAQIKAFDIRCPGPQARTGTLSGGNLQKALLARELAFEPMVLIVAQPTRGLDIGAARFIHEKLLALRGARLRHPRDRRGSRGAADLCRPHRGHVSRAHRRHARCGAEPTIARLGLMMAGAEASA